VSTINSLACDVIYPSIDYLLFIDLMLVDHYCIPQSPVFLCGCSDVGDSDEEDGKDYCSCTIM
jgi:hypothetical protein